MEQTQQRQCPVRLEGGACLHPEWNKQERNLLGIRGQQGPGCIHATTARIGNPGPSGLVFPVRWGCLETRETAASGRRGRRLWFQV